MDAGCGVHGCWYAQQGFSDCYDSDGGRCILAFAVSRQNTFATSPEGIDLSGCATITAGTITADQIEGIRPDDGVFSGRLAPLHSPAYRLHPASVVSGQSFALTYRPRPGRGLVHREVDRPPAETRPHEQANYPDPEDGDVWYCPQGSWLFHAGQWRAVDGLRLDLVGDEPAEVVVDNPSPRHDGTVRVRGVWR